MADQEGLPFLAAAYFHQDWDLDSPTPDDVLGEFRSDEAGESLSRCLSELRNALDHLDDGGLRRLWIDQLGGDYDPHRDGVTYREWFQHAIDVLSEPQ